MTAQDRAQPVHRVAVRLLPVSPDGKVLLLQGQDPAPPGDLHWVSVGGAVDPGETHEQAAVRELHEETGIVADLADLVGPIGTGVHPFSWNGTDYVSHSTFFAIPVPEDAEVHFGGLEEAEVGNILQASWWTPDALLADGSAASDDLPAMMAVAITAVLGGEG